MAVSVVYVTYPDRATAQKIADQLVKERLAACSNIFPMSSCYWWKGLIEKEDEWVSILKTTDDVWPILRDRVEKIHPYEVPCVVRWTVETTDSYQTWIKEQVM